MKKCSKCNTVKNIDEFALNKTRYDGRQGICKECQRANQKHWYNENKVRHKKNVRKNRKTNIVECKKYIDEIKLNPCVDCKNIFHPVQMDFDHISGKKFRSISKLCGLGQLDKIKEELKKCELVCACCHRLRTYKRQIAAESVGAPAGLITQTPDVRSIRTPATKDMNQLKRKQKR